MRHKTCPFLATTLLLNAPTSLGASALPQDREETEINGPWATVGHPDQPDQLPSEVSAAYESGARRIVVRPGNYHFRTSGRPLFILDGWTRARLSGRGVTLTSSETAEANDLIQMVRCSNVEVMDFILTSNSEPAFQGRATRVKTEPDGKTTCLWQMDTNYQPSPEVVRPMICDPKTHRLKRWASYGTEAIASKTGDDRYTLTLAAGETLAEGDLLIAGSGRTPSKLHLIACRDCVAGNLTLYRNGKAAIREEDGGANRFLGCKWQAGPKPPGASEKPIVSSASEGLLSTGAYPGPDIENSEFGGITLGDCIVVHGAYQSVISAAGTSIVVRGDRPLLAKGQPVRLSAPGYYAEGYVKSAPVKAGSTQTAELDGNYHVPANAWVSNPLRNGQSFKLLNCKVGSTPGHGISLGCDDAFMEKNVIDGCGGAAITAGPAYLLNRADYVHGITLRGNLFRENGFLMQAGQNSAVLISGQGAKGNRNVDIESNVFDSNSSGDISVAWCSIATIKGNLFTAPNKMLSGGSRPLLLQLSSSDSIRLIDNKVEEPNLYRKPFISRDRDVSGLDATSGGLGS